MSVYYYLNEIWPTYNDYNTVLVFFYPDIAKNKKCYTKTSSTLN